MASSENRVMSMVLIIYLLYNAQLSLAAVFIVGDSCGWGPNRNYSDWAAGKSFSVDDTLVFKYLKGHTVDQLEMYDFMHCNTTNPIFSDATGYTDFTIPASGAYYFVSAGFGDCQAGMKLSFNTVVLPHNPLLH